MSSDDEGPKQAAPAAKPAMSRFLKSGGDSDSSDESSDDEEEMSDDDEQEAKPKQGGRFLHGASSGEESDEDVKRVVKSAKDKRLDDMEATGKAMDNALKINDWVAISTGTHVLSNHCAFVPVSVCGSYNMCYSIQSSISSCAWRRGSKMLRSPCLRSTFGR